MEKENDKINKENLTSNQNIIKDKQNEDVIEPAFEDKQNEDVIEPAFDDKQNEEVVEPTLEEKLKETHDKLLRTLADSENQRRRYERETKEAFEYGGLNFARETLSLLDNLQRAHQSIKDDESLKDNKDLSKFLENIKIIEKDLITIFEKNNIKKIDCLNKKFDPNNHQAMLEMEDENVDPGIVLKEIQPGYFFKDKLLRPSFVAVAKRKEGKYDESIKKKNDSTLEEK
ncbi:MAG: molecular chaperone GrpE [Pelagibacterales bacterium]|nr:molecular chaperone GrpE [Pelagibacterales bacterium]|tara:strand:+ start:2055 stop:2741 length:687 start_codon:yes stop_codon:yes gene_type:complete